MVKNKILLEMNLKLNYKEIILFEFTFSHNRSVLEIRGGKRGDNSRFLFKYFICGEKRKKNDCLFYILFCLCFTVHVDHF